MRRACSSGLHDNRSKSKKKHCNILYNQTVTTITFCFLTLTDPTAKVPKTHPELECLCFFPWERLKTLVELFYSSFQPNWFKNHKELPEQTWWVSDPSAWECPPRLRTCMWATDAGTAAGWRCGWTCAPSWWPRADSLITTWYPAGRQKLQVYKKAKNETIASHTSQFAAYTHLRRDSWQHVNTDSMRAAPHFTESKQWPPGGGLQ